MLDPQGLTRVLIGGEKNRPDGTKAAKMHYLNFANTVKCLMQKKKRSIGSDQAQSSASVPKRSILSNHPKGESRFRIAKLLKQKVLWSDLLPSAFSSPWREYARFHLVKDIKSHVSTVPFHE